MSASRDNTGAAGKVPLTVAHVVQNLAVGGLERVVINLMTGSKQRGGRSILYTLGEGGELVAELASSGFEVIPLGKRPGMDYRLPFTLSRSFRGRGVNVVHAHNFSPLVYGSIAGRLARVAGVVYTAHGVKTSSRKKPYLFQRLGLVDKMVFVSEDARKAALRRGGLADRDVETIVNGIDLDRYAGGRGFDRAQKKEALGIQPGESVVGIVARLTPAKDHSNLLRAFKIVLDSGARATLLVVGDGELRRELEAETAALGIRDRVIYLGSRSDVPELLGLMDVFVLSSYTEGLAMTLLEAMAAGLPVVATAVGGNTEAVADGETGIIVPPRDAPALAGAVRELLLDRDKSTAMGQNGRRRAFALFGIDTMVRKYEKIYYSIIGGRS